jgi:hypothetical protein
MAKSDANFLFGTLFRRKIIFYLENGAWQKAKTITRHALAPLQMLFSLFAPGEPVPS